MSANVTEHVMEEYIEEIYNPSSEDLMEAFQQMGMPIEQVARAIQHKINVKEKQNSSDMVIHLSPEGEFPQLVYTNKMLKMMRLIYNPESGALFGKTLENLIIFFLTAIITLGAVVFIGLLAYKFYYCAFTTKLLLKRVSQIQTEKTNLLKIIYDVAINNETFFELIRNAPNRI